MRLQSDLLEVKGRKTIKINKNNIDLKGHRLQLQHRRKFHLFSNRVAATFLFKCNFTVNWASISTLSWVCCDCTFACMYLTLSALFLFASPSREHLKTTVLILFLRLRSHSYWEQGALTLRNWALLTGLHTGRRDNSVLSLIIKNQAVTFMKHLFKYIMFDSSLTPDQELRLFKSYTAW